MKITESTTLMKESVILIALCLADLIATLVLIDNSYAREGNPVMAYYLRHGLAPFVLAKLALVALPIFVVEWSRQFRPRLARNLVRFAIAAYLGIYLVLFLGVNVKPILAKPNVELPGQAQSIISYP